MLSVLPYIPTPSTSTPSQPKYMPAPHMSVILRAVVAMQEGGVKADQQQVVQEHSSNQEQLLYHL